MRVLLIDDKYCVREALKQMINFRESGFDGILEADNGKTGLEIIKREKPDLIITDRKMPEIDGVNLLNALEEMDEHFRIIVISGFSDFEYTRTDVQSKVIGYVLKPINKDILAVAVRKAVQEIEKENGSGMGIYDSVTYILKELGSRRNPEDIDDFSVYLSNIGFLLNGNTTTVVLMKMLNFDKILETSFQSYSVLVLSKLEKLVRDFFSTKKIWVVVKPLTDSREILIMLEMPDMHMEKWEEILHGILYELLEVLKKQIGLECILAVGRGSVMLHEAIRDARRILKSTNLLSEEKIGSIRENSKYKTSFTEPSLKIDLLESAVENCDKEKAMMYLDNIFTLVLSNGSISIGDMELLCADLLGVVSRILKTFKADIEPIREDEKKMFNFTKYIYNPDECKLWMVAITSWIIERISDMKEGLSGRLLGDIVKYIDTYYREDIGLDLLSKKFFITQEHISGLFKKKFGENFVAYITRIRKEKALEQSF